VDLGWQQRYTAHEANKSPEQDEGSDPGKHGNLPSIITNLAAIYCNPRRRGKSREESPRESDASGMIRLFLSTVAA
jgi:hypothetical protein